MPKKEYTEKQRAKRKAYYAANREQAIKDSKAWRDKFPEREKERHVKYIERKKKEKELFEQQQAQALPPPLTEFEKKVKFIKDFQAAKKQFLNAQKEKFLAENHQQLQEYLKTAREVYRTRRKERYAARGQEENKLRHDLYEEKNKEHLVAYRKKYYQEHKEKILAFHKEWEKKNEEHLKEYRRRYYENTEETREKNKVKAKKYRAKKQPKISS